MSNVALVKNFDQFLTHTIYQMLNRFQSSDLFFNHHYLKISEAVQTGRMLEFILPAFPAKSANRNKAIGKAADFADYLGLKRLNEFAVAVSRIYSPGCRIHICSDGRVFAGLVGIDDSDVDLYSKSIKSIVEKANLTHLSFTNLEDFFSERDFHLMRARLDREFAEPIDSLRNRMTQDPELRFLFNGIHRFMFEDYLFLRPELSRNQVRKLTKELTYKVIQRSNSWSKLAESLFPEAIRLSIHPQVEAGSKFPVSLVESRDFWRTPWHSVAVFDGQKYSLMQAGEAEKLGAILETGDMGLPFYRLGRGTYE